MNTLTLEMNVTFENLMSGNFNRARYIYFLNLQKSLFVFSQ